MQDQTGLIAEQLTAWGKQLHESPPGTVEFTDNPNVDRMMNDLSRHPHAFVFGCLMARQVKYQKSLSVPYYLGERLGGLDITMLRAIAQEDIAYAMSHPTPLHRHWSKMGEVIHRAIHHIWNAYDGDASRIWTGTPSSALVVWRFLEFHGAGPKIASMAANILARDFRIPFSDHYSIDISADVHVKRVFNRLRLVREDANENEIIFRARSLCPEFPGLLDYPCWEIGRKWCRPTKPLCGQCPMSGCCPSARKIP